MTYSLNFRPLLKLLLAILIAFLVLNVVSYNSRMMVTPVDPNWPYDTLRTSATTVPFIQYK
jgi:hypothetical protein